MNKKGKKEEDKFVLAKNKSETDKKISRMGIKFRNFFIEKRAMLIGFKKKNKKLDKTFNSEFQKLGHLLKCEKIEKTELEKIKYLVKSLRDVYLKESMAKGKALDEMNKTLDKSDIVAQRHEKYEEHVENMGDEVRMLKDKIQRMKNTIRERDFLCTKLKTMLSKSGDLSDESDDDDYYLKDRFDKLKEGKDKKKE